MSELKVADQHRYSMYSSRTKKKKSDTEEITENENEFIGVSINSDSSVVCFSAP